jgi:hypothetical protein
MNGRMLTHGRRRRVATLIGATVVVALGLASLGAARPAAPPLAPASCTIKNPRNGQQWLVAVERVTCAETRGFVLRLSRTTVPASGILYRSLSRTCAGKPIGRAPWDIRCLYASGAWFHAGLKTTALGKTVRDDLKPSRCPDYKDTSGKAWEIRYDDVNCGTVTTIIGVITSRPVPAGGRYSAIAYRLPMQCSAAPAGQLPTFVSCIGSNWASAAGWKYVQARVKTASAKRNQP